MERQAFLDRLRSRRPDLAPRNIAHPLADIEGVTEIRYEQDLDDVIAAFERSAALVGASVRRGERGEVVRAVMEESGARTAALSRDPECDGLHDVLANLGVDAADPSTADIGIVGAEWGIAATGTVVISASRAGLRSASLLPPALLVLLHTDHVLPHAGALFRSMGDRFPNGVPSQLVLASGPSRSGDIELELTIGVHGPGRVWIGLLGSPAVQ